MKGKGSGCYTLDECVPNDLPNLLVNLASSSSCIVDGLY